MKNWFLFFIVWFLGLHLFESATVVESGFEFLPVGKSEFIHSITGVSHWQAGLLVSKPCQLFYLVPLSDANEQAEPHGQAPDLVTAVDFSLNVYKSFSTGLFFFGQFQKSVSLYLKHCFLRL